MEADLWRILIVDDDETARMLARAALESSDVEVLEAADGLEAIEVAERTRPDLIVLDVLMPRLDGFEACRRLRRTEAGETVPILMMTGLDDTASIDAAYEVGATDFVAKPVDWTIFRHRARYLTRAGQSLRALHAARAAAEAASRAKSEFLANVSHEIRTPLTAVLGFADELMSWPSVDAEQRDILSIIRRNGAHLLRLLNDILDVAKLESGRVEVERKSVDIRGLVNELVGLMRVTASQKGIELASVCAEEVPALIEGDPTKLSQILLNLVGNGLKFTEVGGVRVTTSVDPKSNAEKCYLRIEVADTGIGFAQAESGRLFDAFVQGEGDSRRRFGGAGLGLAISKRLVGMLGGAIGVDSTPGNGARFWFTFEAPPLACAEPAAPPPQLGPGDADSSASLPVTGRGRVLLVEDGKDNQRLIAMILRRAGLEVEIAENGRIGVDRVLSEGGDGEWDLIVMDIQMPVLDGISATTELRRAGIEIPILALSAHAGSADRDLCLAAGCDDFASKPIDRMALVNAVSRLLTKTRPAAA